MPDLIRDAGSGRRIARHPVSSGCSVIFRLATHHGQIFINHCHFAALTAESSLTTSLVNTAICQFSNLVYLPIDSMTKDTPYLRSNLTNLERPVQLTDYQINDGIIDIFVTGQGNQVVGEIVRIRINRLLVQYILKSADLIERSLIKK
jgi:hypothetical protein